MAPGTGAGASLWLVYLEGSMFCWSEASCKEARCLPCPQPCVLPPVSLSRTVLTHPPRFYSGWKHIHTG